jgi:hypothetical protein
MKLKNVAQGFAVFMMAFILSACVSAPQYNYSAFKAAHPTSIVILPPKNLSPDVKATYSLLAQMTNPLAEAGYYVVPVALMDAAFKENGVYSADDAQTIPVSKLQSIFGADAALYTEITEFGNSYKLITAETVVAARCKLIDLRTGTLLWEGNARASSAEQNNNSGNGLAAMLIKAAVDQIVHSLVDNSYTYAGIASQRMLTPHSAGILHGPRSPFYGKEAK